MQGWIKLHRKIVDWEWYDDLPTFKLFIHLLLKANYEEKNWRGQKIEKGTLVTSLSSLSAETGLSERQVRTALTHLKKTGEIDKQSTRQNTLIIVMNYSVYQDLSDIPPTQCRHSADKRATTNKNDKNVKNDKNNISISKDIDCQTETVRPDIKPVVDAWNALSNDTAIKPISKMLSTSKRYQMLVARIKEYSLDDVLKAIEKIKQSDFLKGNNNKGWIITFGWFVRPNNFPKVFEGDYDNRGSSNNPYIRY